MTRETNDSLRSYFVAIARHPLLTPTEELTLGKQVMELQRILEQGGPTNAQERIAVKRGERAKRRFINANLRLVVTVAKNFKCASNTLELIDLIQEGNFGLVRAVERFDYTRGYKFSTYSFWWISQAIRRALQRYDRPIKLPSQIADIACRLSSIRHKETQRLGREPSVPELADACKMKEAELRLLLDRSGGLTRSLDTMLTHDDGQGSTLLDFIYDKDQEDDREEDLTIQHDTDRLRKALSYLTDKEQEVLRARYGFDEEERTFAAIGRDMGLSRERTRQLTSRSITKLKYLMDSPAPQALGRNCV